MLWIGAILLATLIVFALDAVFRFRTRKEVDGCIQKTLESVRNGTYNKKPSETYLTLRADHFEVRKRTSADIRTVRWSDILAMDAYKIDLWSTDCICVAFTTASTSLSSTLPVNKADQPMPFRMSAPPDPIAAIFWASACDAT